VETIKHIFTNFNDDTIIIFSFMAIFFACIIIAYWLYNRKKFQELSHQIPASVVKNYLDSIIQNSTALKSSLFRGGGLDLGQGIPSVVPVQELPTGNVGGPSQEELNQKNAEIQSLNARLAEKDATIDDLNKRLAEGSGAPPVDTAPLEKEIEDLKAKLAEASSGSGDAGEVQKQLDTVSKERDELKERLMEYEIIEEDLANLKKLQQENEELKKQLADGGAPAAAEPAPAPEPEPAPAEEPQEDLEAAMANAIEETPPAPEAPPEEVQAASEDLGVPENEDEQKSAEELLGEFEKMLG
jgi:hypothetical protein